MADFRPGTDDQTEFLDELSENGLLIPSGVPGVYGRGQLFEDVRLAFDDLVTRVGAADGAERLRFPPILPREQFESSGYLKSFPHLAGSIFGFEGNEKQALEQQERAAKHVDWSEFQEMTELVLVPAACYPVYPAIARRGPLPEGGEIVDAGGSYVVRHEPSGDPARLQMFHQREIVRIGEPGAVAGWREMGRARAVPLLPRRARDSCFAVAPAQSFGRSAGILAASQREQALKFEI